MSNTHKSVSLVTLFAVFVALMVLLGATVWVAHLELKPVVSLIVALSIAGLKAILIVLFFMNVKYSSHRVWLFAGAGFFWLLILLSILDDYMTRGWLGVWGSH
jgi:cytochrome c oxidase subunit 4